ncbi:hypothetical protein HZA41_02810 [Candidatus Peregrinibacteria bacterium]|nr:hypothetical protein [Candidatus Peregrinibacteria bacterium]
MPDKKKNTDESMRVPLKHVIYLDIDDEITDIFERIKPLAMNDIYLVVPSRAVLFSSVVHLKILKRKLADLGKKISLVTNDPVGIRLARLAGMAVFDRIEKSKDLKNEVASKTPRIAPLKAVSNPISNDEPTKLRRKKMSIFEIVQKAQGNTVKFSSPFRLNRPNFSRFFSIFSARRKMITALSLTSLVLLFFIGSVTLPGATISVTPNSNVIEISVNVTLADSGVNAYELSLRPDHMIASYPVTATISKTLSYFSTGKISKGQNAVGKITVTNETAHDWPLVSKTRFQTKEGLIFRLTSSVTVPRAGAQGFGTLEIAVQADPFDAYDQPIGERGNIGKSEFFLPGLRESSQKQLYGKSSEPFTGGTTSVVHVVSDEDIVAAREKAKTAIRASVEEELAKYVSKLNSENNTNLSLLEEDLAIRSSEPQIFIADSLSGKEMESFEVRAEMSASGIAYNRGEFFNILKTELTNNKSPDKNLATIDEASVFYRIFEINDDSKKMKLTATIKGIEEYNLESSKGSESRLAQKIIEHSMGKSKEEALDYIQNLPEINRARITTWPSWSPNLPKVAKNIEVVILREGEEGK